ncbi:hypothetical protein [Agromyces albus]|uniref:hypothetical protein n=1 Tax=Agromyces albus TaxID=205332 RepID=UPI00278869B4|nr:hypothetical protein [Agromyces albus]MDQ0576623.1 hypothetical protein [Agromyces albus]
MRILTKIRVWLWVLIAGLLVSGITAFPLETELRLASALLHADWSPAPAIAPDFVGWVDRVSVALTRVGTEYPFIAYGTDWLAFAHLVIAIVFIGPLIDPVRNIWVIQFGFIACLGIIPLALIAGSIRGIPFGWQLIDISFGVLGAVPLYFAWRLTRKLESEARADPAPKPERADVPEGTSARSMVA